MGEQSAILILSEIFDGNTDQLLGEARLFAAGNGTNRAVHLTGSDTISLGSESVRIRTYGLVAGSGQDGEPPLHSFFHEFETTAIPEPSIGVIGLLVFVSLLRRERRLC